MKRWYFRNHWWLHPVLAIASVAVVFLAQVPEKGSLLGAIVASALSASFFVQQQKLAEMKLLKELFSEFTRRYDAMNGALEVIVRTGQAPGDSERQAIIDYFNLFAEEYLFFVEGYLDPRVWQSWCRGMLYYFDAPAFRDLWATEGSRESYYGLTLEEIRNGAT